MATATATIDLNAIRHNWQKLRSMSSKDTGAVVKANAYGLGLKQVAKALYVEGARIFFVATAEAVSYTHLRAHETDSYLVCRLLLEKKKV